MERNGAHAPAGIALAVALLSASACGTGASGGDSGDGDNADTDAPTDLPQTGDTPPTPVPTLPADGETEVLINTELCWEGVEFDEPVRYQVYVDGLALTEGILDPDGLQGFEGPCTPEVLLEPDREYELEVQAFVADDPDRASPRSQANVFHTEWDGKKRELLRETFEDEPDWTVEGDASQGAWTWGTPEQAVHKPSLLVDEVSQPGQCHMGEGCVFTGQNPDGASELEDLAGDTTLVSPSFELAGARSVAVSIARFVYKENIEETGSRLRVTLVVEDGGAGTPFVLEEIEELETRTERASWDVTTLSGCGFAPLDGDGLAHLELTAQDPGDGVFEAAVDSIVVTAFQTDDACSDGVGALCDPTKQDACGIDLSCCPVGVLNTGLWQCLEPVPSLDVQDPPPGPDDPPNGPLGCPAPDLVVPAEEIEQIYIEQVEFEEGDCAILEGCVGGPGLRTLLRFDTPTANVGGVDLAMGLPANHPDLFHYDACHKHFHYDGFSNYELVDGDEVLGVGHKQSFCLLDWRSWAWPFLQGQEADGDDWTYNCFNQGISAGWEDVYAADVDCQWIDVTDVEPGTYTLRMEVNPTAEGASQRPLVESDYDNNVTDVEVEIP